MRKRLVTLIAFTTISFVILGGITFPPALAAGQSYSFNWNGTPATPLAWSDPTWDVLVHERDTTLGAYPVVEPMQAVHGPTCGAPPATHPISTAPNSVFICNNHLMTAINGSDYGLIVLTPSQEVDFRNGASVTYSVSTLRTSLRDWTDIWITPFNENLVGPLESWLPDLQGPPKDVVHVRMNVFNGGTIFTAEVVNNFVSTDIVCCSGDLLEQKLSTSAATRTQFELDLSPTHLKFGIPSLNLWWIDNPATIPFTRGIVQIAHHSYNPSKDCVGDVGSTPGCPPNTWHWSNFGISNAIPFAMIKPDLQNFTGPTVAHFATPAPASAFLRFHAIGVGLQVSLNGGNFVPAIEARELGMNATGPPFIHDEHFKDYWMAIPAGTTSVAFRGQPWPGGDAIRVQDLSIWSENGATPPPPPPPSAPAGYTPVTPVRLLDTRNMGGPLGPAGSRILTVAGVSPVPAGATAVVLNVTATDTTTPGYFTVYPTGGSQPLASNLNWTAGSTIPNLVSVQVGTGGAITFYNGAGSANVVVDLEGYFAPPSGTAGGEVALTPARITDTRPGSGQANAGKTLGPGSTLNIQITAAGGVPATGVAGAILNVTATNTTAARTGALTVWPTGAAQPLASNLNWLAGQTVPNRVFVPVGTGGQVSVFNFAGSTDVVVDVSGYFTDATATGKQFSAVSPVRLIDTRDTGQTLGPTGTLTLQVSGIAGVPSTATAVILNVTVTNTSGSSFLIAYPSTAVRPTASDLNWVGGRTTSNMVVATLDSTGALTFYNGVGSTDVVVDLAGWYS